MKRFIIRTAFVAVILILMEPNIMHACPVCFGQTESGSEQGVNAAVWLMVGVTGGVLGMLSAFFLRIRKRMRNTLNRTVDLSARNR